jgi:uncharacterized integral membrane protein (TIGR00697 family)
LGFPLLEKKTGGKYLWLRNNASTIASQFIATVIFYVIGFYGIFPILRLIIFTYLIKILIAILDTPVVYLAVGFLRRNGVGQQEEVVVLEGVE